MKTILPGQPFPFHNSDVRHTIAVGICRSGKHFAINSLAADALEEKPKVIRIEGKPSSNNTRN